MTQGSVFASASAAWTIVVLSSELEAEEEEEEAARSLPFPLDVVATPALSNPASGPLSEGAVELTTPPTVSTTLPMTGPTTGRGLAMDDTRPSEPMTLLRSINTIVDRVRLGGVVEDVSKGGGECRV